jgi:ribulose-5-phosphate 4-epimerase/fuculose-1-phosphate aldolase
MQYDSSQTVAMRVLPAGLGLLVALAWFGLSPIFPFPTVEEAEAQLSVGGADPSLVEDLVAANRILYQEGIVDGFGHVSVRHNADPNRFLLSRSRAPELVTAEDILEYDLDANAVDFAGAQYLERFIHSEIYKARPDVTAVVHNHSPGLVPFGVSSIPLRPLYHMAAFISSGIPVFDIRDAFGVTQMLVSDSMRGQALAESLGDRPAVLMRGHGVVVVGRDLRFAVGRSIYLEVNGQLQAQAIALGGDVTYLSVGESQAYMDEAESYDRPWDLWKLHALGQ